ncbi:MazG nucleotide pyrophosphohydrolase domain protein [Bacteriovorax sp. BSW11_IV]|uniref:nucleoside triphosphate pyrophosphohydrolase family protein n=1 Tax=Bacteriovorax sp. BSW11_IV TaxID=1353529 RepID=UPI00038A38AE|nr:nucleoside triphosphate pyrophosphohydrolase family protein [Bacteriovorax sp. BSW11_IV]EQC46454.1 MazG nucleotide pyrophosphohydrolase domain protein [Bacteriovorax sp. BSW11_IV]
MDSKNYIKDAIKTEATNFEAMNERLMNDGTKRLLHAGIGISTEAGEVLDALKKHIFYGKELDKVNLAEELGDLFWYMAILADELGIEFESVMDRNITKLKARYGEKFSEEKAEKRDLDKEREILEGQKFN